MPVNYLRMIGLSVELFRKRYGIAANPEDHPKLWDDCREDAEMFLEEEANGNE